MNITAEIIEQPSGKVVPIGMLTPTGLQMARQAAQDLIASIDQATEEWSP